MATFPLDLPTPSGFATMQLRMESVTAMDESPFTFAQQVFEHQGQRWSADITLPPMKRADAQKWSAWFGLLRGRSKTFLMGDPLGQTPQGSAGGTPVVNGIDQTGSFLVIDGAATSQTGWLLAGDYIQLGTGATTRLHMITEDVDTDGSGNATLPIWPDIRTSPADGATVTVSGCEGIWRINSNIARWDINEASAYGFSFTAVEAVTA
jgi:hypothetical protein